MEKSESSEFEFELRKVMEKHGMSKSFCLYHPKDTAHNAVKVVYFNRPSLEWILGSFENLAREIEHRRKKGLILSGSPQMPDINQSDVPRGSGVK
jgi:hypothetical protein